MKLKCEVLEVSNDGDALRVTPPTASKPSLPRYGN